MFPPQGGRKHPHQNTFQVNTEKILSFVVAHLLAWTRSSKSGLAKKVMGFGSPTARGRASAA